MFCVVSMHSFKDAKKTSREIQLSVDLGGQVTTSRVIRPSRVTVRVVLILKTLLKGLSAHQTLDKRPGDEKGRSVLSADRENGGRFLWSAIISMR